MKATGIVQGRRRRGNPNRRLLDSVWDDIRGNDLSGEGMYDRATRMGISSCIDHIYMKVLILTRRPHRLFAPFVIFCFLLVLSFSIHPSF